MKNWKREKESKMPATTRPVTTQDRTYTTYYITDVNGQKGHDQVIFYHPNGLCVVCLSERHPMCIEDNETATPSVGGGFGGGGGDEDASARGDGAEGGGAGSGGGEGGGGKRKREDDDAEEGRAKGDIVAAAEASGASGSNSKPADDRVSYGALAEVDFR